MNLRRVVLVVTLILMSGLIRATAFDTIVSTEAWRQAYEAKLRAPDGWLSVAGLFFLKPGANTLGTDASSDIVLPRDSAPAHVGTVRYADDRVLFEPAPDVQATLNGDSVHGPVELHDSDEALHRKADKLVIGRLTLLAHTSGDRMAIRLRDPLNPLRMGFPPLAWFPIQPAWRVTGRFIPYDAPKRIPLQNVLGDVADSTSPGEVEVTLAGQTVRLLVLDDDDKLWLVFSDRTSRHETYRIRFLYMAYPDATRQVVLDFNRAENPPCAYNAFTTCPMPPRQNRLSFAIPAGERLPPGHGSESKGRAFEGEKAVP
jgi:uncharacterized protein (DUF1684 family)